jgi:hypothetical protein
MIWALLFLITTNLFAADCSLYELQGDVDLESHVSLTVNKGAKSQKVFRFTHDIRFEMGPYIKKTVRGSFVTKDLEILKIKDVKTVVPDPLHHFQEMVFLKKVPCPAAKKKGP